MIRHVHWAPIFLDFLLVMANLRNTREGRPIRRLLVVEADVDVCVVVELVELVRRAVCDEEEVELRLRVRWKSFSQVNICTLDEMKYCTHEIVLVPRLSRGQKKEREGGGGKRHR